MIVKKMMVILNPNAGRGRGIKTLPKIEKWSREIYSQKGIMSRIELTVPDPFSEKHATNLAQRAVKENYDLVFAAGGDGTANEVANGLKTGNDLFGRNTAMATGRIGSGSDLAEALDIPWDIWKALNLAASGNTMLMDLGKINGRFFC
jgi:diacylglycerol kinase (ATP)